MVDMYKSGAGSRLDQRQMHEKSNAPIGFPRSEKTTALTNNKLFLRGPSVEIDHPPEYNSLKYRCNNSGETMKYGIAGIRNLTTSSWITQYISEVDKFGTTISFTPKTGRQRVEKNDVCLVYYYAKVSVGGGLNVTPMQGDLFLPEALDILVRKLNDSHPSRFGEFTGCQGNAWEYRLDTFSDTTAEVSRVASPPTGATTILEENTAADFPVYATEVTVKFDAPANWANIHEIWVSVTIDDSPIFRGFDFGSDKDWLMYVNMDPADYPDDGTATFVPGSLSSDDVGLFFDLYKDDAGKICFRFPTKCEVLESIKVELVVGGAVGSKLENVDCYVRGWRIKS